MKRWNAENLDISEYAAIFRVKMKDWKSRNTAYSEKGQSSTCALKFLI